MEALQNCSPFQHIQSVNDLYEFRGRIIAVFSDEYFAALPKHSSNYRLGQSPVGFAYIPSDFAPNSETVCLASLIRTSTFGTPIVVDEENLKSHQLHIRDPKAIELKDIRTIIRQGLGRFYNKSYSKTKAETDQLLGLAQTKS